MGRTPTGRPRGRPAGSRDAVPRKPPTEEVRARIPVEIVARFDARAAERRLSRTELLAEVIEREATCGGPRLQRW